MFWQTSHSLRPRGFLEAIQATPESNSEQRNEPQLAFFLVDDENVTACSLRKSVRLTSGSQRPHFKQSSVSHVLESKANVIKRQYCRG
jgi:hypothetical protein